MQTSRRAFLVGLGAASTMALAHPQPKPPPSGPRFYVAALTPVGRDGSLDESLARDLLAYFSNNGVDGVLVLGTTGEFSSFSVRERKQILETMARYRGDLELICNVTTPNLPETMELLEHAAGTGADKALVLPPYYFKNPGIDGLEAFFAPLLEAASIPVLLYHIPSYSGVPITMELVERLSRYDSLFGIKDSSGDLEGLLSFIRKFPKLKVLTGSNRLLSQALQAGGGGAITGNGNLIPGETADLFNAFRAGSNLEEAQRKLNEATAGMPWRIPEMKFALGELGLRESFPRPPFTELTPEEKAALKARIAEYKAWKKS